MPFQQKRNVNPKHISVQMSSPFYSYTESEEVRYITIQYWNGGIYFTFMNKITDENVEEISFRMPEHVIKDFSTKLGRVMLSRRDNYMRGQDYEEVSLSYPIGSFQEDRIVKSGEILIYTTPVNGVPRVVIEAKKDGLSIPIIFHSDYVITDVSPENQNKLRYIDIYDTKIWSLYQALQTSSSPLYRAIYNTAEQIIRSITTTIDEKFGSGKKNYYDSYGSRGSYRKSYDSDKSTEGGRKDSDEIPF